MDEMNNINRFVHYNHLLTLSYDEAVTLLLDKYGQAKDDYFREKSYERFLNKEIKSIAKGKYSRTSEGLYCHHIDENKYSNLSNLQFILAYKYSFELQKKEKLVYCDLFEHLILHALITKETNGEYGFDGYSAYLYPTIIEWYIGRVQLLKKEWMIKCFERAFLSPEETRNLLIKINLLLPVEFQNEGEIRYISPEERQHEWRRECEERGEKMKKQIKEWKEKEKLQKEQEIKQQIKEFYQAYPKFEKMDIHFDTPRKIILSMLFDLKYSNEFKNKKELDLSMKKYYRDELLDELYSIIAVEM